MGKFKNILQKIKKRPGLILLIIILIVINFASLKPQFYFLGWDNYSSYFNLKTNILRTLFSTWREYRGLGAPSDSESVDLFRQIFFWIFSFLVKESLLDQIYILFCLDVGTIGMYFFSQKLFCSTLFKEKKQYLDLTCFTTSFFFLFNLNTLATFYFPMIMYINRFASLPILFLLFFKLIKERNIQFKTLILSSICFLFISGSFLTATVFITFIIFLPIFTLFLGNYKRQVLIYLFFIGLNFFWLLPFGNYAIQSAKTVRLAPTFIDANETQLNKPASFYSVSRLLLLYPNFFDSSTTDISNNEPQPLHPKTTFFNQKLGKFTLFIFPFLYLTGAFLVLVKYRKKALIWLPLTIFISLFFVGKQYTFLGAIYNLLEQSVPYFSVLFRFADTKINIFLCFSGALTASLVLYFLFTFIDENFSKFKKIKLIVFPIPFLLTIFSFSSYFQGNLLGFFMYNKIPPVYFEIAKTINKDEESFRVLHLPMNKNGYWKSYVWGMYGSSFLHFMLDKPIIDRTFEPASMENTYLHQAIFQITENTQNIESQQKLEKRAEKLYSLLKKTGVKYVIWDETVSNSAYSRGVNFWGEFNLFDVKELLETLKKTGALQVNKTYQINIKDYFNLYPQRQPLKQSIVNQLAKNPNYSIQLLEVKNPASKIYFTQKAEILDPDLNNLLTTNLALWGKDYIQSKNKPTGIIYPFQRQDLIFNTGNNSLNLNFKNPFNASADYFVEFHNNELEVVRYYIEVFARIEDGNLILNLYQLLSPLIQGQKINQSLGEIKIPFDQNLNQLSLNINGLILPIPTDLGSQEKYLNTIIVSEGKIMVKLLAKDKSINLNLSDFKLTENPNCFGDKLNDYNHNLKIADSTLLLESKNGSTCIFKDISQEIDEQADHLEIIFNIRAKNKDLDALYSQNLSLGSKPLLKNYLLNQPKPNLFRVCLKEPNVEDCFNKHQVLYLQDEQSITVPLEKPIKDIYKPLILLASKNIGFQEQKTTINSIILNQFKNISNVELEIKPSTNPIKIQLNAEPNVSLKLPKASSNQSFYSDPQIDGFDLSNQLCEKENSYRTFRLINNKLVSYFENCSNLISVKKNFNSNNFYLWSLDYHLFSGKYPRYILDDDFHYYKNDYLSLNQSYPDISFFKDLQKPEGILTKLSKNKYQKSLAQKFENIDFQPANTYIYPQPELNDQKIKYFTLHQDSENEGILSISSFNITELPNYWQNLAIRKENSFLEYDLPEKVEYKQILPSLWQVKIQATSNNKPLLLVFNEAYDKQWKIYRNLKDLIVGKKITNSTHLKLNGYANAWEINNPKGQALYIFYWPEKLAWTGWIITSVVLLSCFLKKLFFLPSGKQKS